MYEPDIIAAKVALNDAMYRFTIIQIFTHIYTERKMESGNLRPFCILVLEGYEKRRFPVKTPNLLRSGVRDCGNVKNEISMKSFFWISLDFFMCTFLQTIPDDNVACRSEKYDGDICVMWEVKIF